MNVAKKIFIYCFICIVSLTLSFIASSSLTKKYITRHMMELHASEYKLLPTIKKRVPGEKIDRWIQVPSYDGSNEVTHPKVLYFENGLNGYKYWMVNTPYPGNNAYLENPSIVVSNNGIDWIEPKGINNPVSGYPTKVRDDSYYSDPFMLYDEDHFELFFRKTKSILNGKKIMNGYNYLYMQTSKDGIRWSKPKMILGDNAPERYMSVSVIKEDDLYKFWYVNYDGCVRYIESTDLKKFSKPKTIDFKNFNKKVWHGEVQYDNGKYTYIFMIKYSLYYTESTDGINFDEPKLIDTNIESLCNKYSHIYKTTYIIGDKYVELYVPYRVNYKWKMHYTKVLKNEFFKEIDE